MKIQQVAQITTLEQKAALHDCQLKEANGQIHRERIATAKVELDLATLIRHGDQVQAALAD